MARSSRSRSYRSDTRRSARRDYHYSIANLRLPRYSTPRLMSMNDFRTFHPERAFRPLLRPSGRTVVVSRPVQRSNRQGRFYRMPPPHKLFAEAPRSVIVCVRRRQRKEVLHAYNRTGRRGQRRPRRNSRSDIIC